MARTLRSLFWITFDPNRSFPGSRSSSLKLAVRRKGRACLRDQFKVYQEKHLAIDPADQLPAACF